jgi:hypothetical protein
MYLTEKIGNKLFNTTKRITGTLQGNGIKVIISHIADS